MGSGVKLLLTCSSLLPMLILLARDLADLTSALDFDDDTRLPGHEGGVHVGLRGLPCNLSWLQQSPAFIAIA